MKKTIERYLVMIPLVSFILLMGCKANRQDIKFVEKEAKRLQSEGFWNLPGDLPVAKQLEKSFNLRQTVNEDGSSRYYLTTQQAKAETFAAAKLQVQQLCLSDIASQIGSNILGKIKSSIANSEKIKDATSVTEVISAYQNTVIAKLGRTEPIVILKRMQKSKLTEIYMTMKYDIASAEAMVKEDLRKELKEKTEELQEEIDNLLQIKN